MLRCIRCKEDTDYFKTEEGWAAYEETCEDFNWGDMETYIPDAFFKPCGVAHCDGYVYPAYLWIRMSFRVMGFERMKLLDFETGSVRDTGRKNAPGF